MTAKMSSDNALCQSSLEHTIQAQANNVTFQQDNARPHVARVGRDYLTQQNVDLLPWPAVSPDLSPIEHVWDEMERQLRHLPYQPVTLTEMGPALIRIWNNIPLAFFNNLVIDVE
jgi:transposase